MLSRIEPNLQKDILKECAPTNWREKADFELRQIDYYVQRHQQELSGAPFRTNDAKLYPEMGPCTKCSFNTANQPLLFDDEKSKKKYCFKPSCFQIKVTRHKKQSLEAIAADPDRIVVTGSSYLDNDDKATVEAAKELGINVLDEKLYERMYSEPDDPTLSYEKWFELNGEDGYDEDTEEEKAELEQENRENYAAYAEDNEIQLKNQREAVENGLYKMAYVLTGYNAGKEIAIKLKSNAAGVAGGSSESNGIQHEISNIEVREMRNKNLDAEKVHAAVQTLLFSSEKYKGKRDLNLTPAELKAIPIALYEAGSYTFRDWMKAKFNLSDRYNLRPEDLERFSAITEFGINDILRHFILEKLECNMASGASRLTLAKAAAVHALALEHEEMKVHQIVLDQESIASARAERVSKRIAALKRKISEPEPAVK
jgi:hypothetical protein